MRARPLNGPEGAPPRRLDLTTAGGEVFAAIVVPSAKSHLAELSSAERAVVLEVLRGQSHADIARTRSTSPRTIANQLASVYAKLGIGSRVELAAMYGRPPRQSRTVHGLRRTRDLGGRHPAVRLSDLVRVTRSAYDLQQGDEAWLLALAERVAPMLGDELGVDAYRYEVTRPWSDWFREGNHVRLGAEPATPSAIEVVCGLVPGVPELLHVDSAPLTLLSEQLDFKREAIGQEAQRRLAALGATDLLVLRAPGSGGTGVVIAAAQRGRRRFGAQERFRWSAVAAHVGAADTLRRRLSASGLAASVAVDPDNRASTPGGPGQGLRETLQRLDRDGGSDDADVLVSLWEGIAEGRWSIVDHFETADRRYLVAYRHPALVVDPRALSEREHDVAVFVGAGANNRQVAQDLGMSPSTVSTHLASALSKLGLTSRLDLVGLIGRFAHAVPLERDDKQAAARPTRQGRKERKEGKSPRSRRS